MATAISFHEASRWRSRALSWATAGVLGLDLLSAIKRGAVIQPRGVIAFSVLDAKTQRVVRVLRYEFSDKSTLGWDPRKAKPVWKGFEVRGR